MNTALLSFIRHTPTTRAAYVYGKGRGRSIHVSTTAKATVRHFLTAVFAANQPCSPLLSFGMRPVRRSIYLGQWAALRAERRLMAAFKL